MSDIRPVAPEDEKNPRYPSQTVEFTIDMLHTHVCEGSIIPEDLIWLFHQCLIKHKKDFAYMCLQTTMFQFSNSRLTRRQAVTLMDYSMKFCIPHDISFVIIYFILF
jgi:hypothetical protein